MALLEREQRLIDATTAAIQGIRRVVDDVNKDGKEPIAQYPLHYVLEFKDKKRVHFDANGQCLYSVWDLPDFLGGRKVKLYPSEF
jgi:hypothetical protein